MAARAAALLLVALLAATSISAVHSGCLGAAGAVMLPAAASAQTNPRFAAAAAAPLRANNFSSILKCY